jgi:hypothetical protein
MDVALSEDDTTVGEFARAILEAFPTFKTFNVAFFNRKAGNIDNVIRCVIESSTIVCAVCIATVYVFFLQSFVFTHF